MTQTNLFGTPVRSLRCTCTERQSGVVLQENGTTRCMDCGKSATVPNGVRGLHDDLTRALIEYGRLIEYMSNGPRAVRECMTELDALQDSIIGATRTLRGAQAADDMAELLRGY